MVISAHFGHFGHNMIVICYNNLTVLILTVPGPTLESEIESESDVCKRQILTSKVDPGTVRVKIFIMAVDP